MRSVGCVRRSPENAMADSEDRGSDAGDLDTLSAAHADVRAAYRSASAGDEPSEALDAAILAASRRAVKAGPASIDRPGRLASRLAVPLSAAAVMVLATSLSFLVYEERGTPSPPEESRAPATVSGPAEEADRGVAAPVPPAAGGAADRWFRVAPESEAPATPRSSPLPARTERSAGVPEVPRPAASPPPASPTPDAPAAVPPSDAGADAPALRALVPGAREEQAVAAQTRAAEIASERAVAGNDGSEALRRHDAAREASAAVAAKRLASRSRESAADSAVHEAASPKAAPSPEETPAAWIARVRALVDAGRIESARIEVARLRCRYPDVTLPTDLPAADVGTGCPALPAKEGPPDLR
jgi:resuscitation-promoting factor RpfA